MPEFKNAPLPDGLEIDQYRIVKKIAAGGFSFVYLALDSNDDPVAIKEFLPEGLVQRLPGELAPTITPANLPLFHMGLKCFFEEGRSLARVLHPNVVRVLNFFSANQTVYMVMAYRPGLTLQEYLHKQRTPHKPPPLVPERIIRNLFTEIIQGLREVHANRILHLDLKPANLYLPRNAGAILLDFGAARQTLSANFPKLTAMYTPGYAAPEIQLKSGSLGPWTDIYGLGASIYACMTGGAPQSADLRRTGDAVPGQLDLLKKHYSTALVEAVRSCLMPDPETRIPSLHVLQKILAQPEKIAPAEVEKTATRVNLVAKMSQWLSRSAKSGKTDFK